MKIKDIGKLVDILKTKLPIYLEINKYIVEGGKCQCPNKIAHTHGDTGKLSASFLPNTNKTKMYCFVENRIFDIFDVYAIVNKTDIRGEGFFIAVKALCTLFKIPFEEVDAYSPQEIEKSKKIKVLSELHRLSIKNAKNGIDYYKRRNLTSEKIKFFRIGFVTPDLITRDFNKAFKASFGYGISSTLDKPSLVIPVYDEYWQYKALVIRQFDGDKSSRYLNYSVDGKGLYNVNNIKKQDAVYVVEGSFDAMALYPETNVIGTLTNGIKDGDLDYFRKKQFSKIFLALDQDNTDRAAKADGIASTIMRLKDVDSDIQVIQLPNATDPDEIVTAKGTEYFFSLPRIGAIKYLVECHKEGRLDLKEVYRFIAACPDIVKKECYVDFLSKEINVGKRALSQEIDKVSGSETNINLIEYANEKSATENLLDEFEEVAWNNLFQSVPSGFKTFDSKMGGFEDTIYMIIAYPERGKSLLLLNYARHLLRNDDNFVAFYSLDDGVKRAILPRFLSMITGLSSKVIKQPEETHREEWKAGIEALRGIKNRFVMKDGSDIRTLHDFEKYLQLHNKMASEQGKKFIAIIDNVHCLVASYKHESVQNTQKVAAFLKRVPQVYECPVICTAEVPKSANKRPSGKDIKESIDLWYASRCVIGLDMPLADDGDTNMQWSDEHGNIQPIIEVYISKNQTGEAWHGSIYYKVRKFDNTLIECTDEEHVLLRDGQYIS